MRINHFIVIAVISMMACPAAKAEVSNFTETFSADASSWVGGDNTALNFAPTGGPDGSSYVSYTTSFATLNDGDSAIGFRANDFNDASADAFVGDWIASDVDEFTFSFRHNLPAPANVFARFASSFNFPGGIAVEFAPALPNTWTEVTIDISELNPQFVSFEGQDFNAVFSSVGNIQLGVSVPNGFGGFGAPVIFDVDNVSVSTNAIPEPSSLALIAGMVSISLIRRKR
ncbi:MAG: PEP-CTERM sorting domain-containing protein [Planctomycetota bacterium]